MLSRHGLDCTSHLPSLAHAIAQIKVDAAILGANTICRLWAYWSGGSDIILARAAAWDGGIVGERDHVGN
jgi:hypothetical protein